MYEEEKQYGSDPQDGDDATNKYSELEARLKALESANVLTPGAAAMWLGCGDPRKVKNAGVFKI